MILFRHAPINRPFLWETSDQPSGRWHAEGEGPAQYFADTPDGAWAEFLRHAEIDDLDEVALIQRNIWVVEVEDVQPELITFIDFEILIGGVDTYPQCQAIAREIRNRGQIAIDAPSAALRRGMACGWQIENGLHHGPPRDGRAVVIFGTIPQATGWLVGTSSAPPHILENYVPL